MYRQWRSSRAAHSPDIVLAYHIYVEDGSAYDSARQVGAWHYLPRHHRARHRLDHPHALDAAGRVASVLDVVERAIRPGLHVHVAAQARNRRHARHLRAVGAQGEVAKSAVLVIAHEQLVAPRADGGARVDLDARWRDGFGRVPPGEDCI